MKNLITLILWGLPVLCFSQKSTLSTQASSGFSTRINGAYFAQVIGQSSIGTGTFKNGGLRAQQGFKQPIFFDKNNQASKNILAESSENPIHYNVYPNPFIDQITLKLSSESIKTSLVYLYSINGTLMWQGSFPANTSSFTLTEFKYIPAGKYQLQIIESGKPAVISLIRESK